MTQKVILSQDFKDVDGVQHHTGDTVDMDDDTYDWLVGSLRASFQPLPTVVVPVKAAPSWSAKPAPDSAS
jgi:hypothetical protein